MAAHAQSLDSLQHVEEVVITGHIVRREVIPVQELSGAQELISAYDALIARAESERAFLQKRMPEYTAGADEIVRRISALAKR